VSQHVYTNKFINFKSLKTFIIPFVKYKLVLNNTIIFNIQLVTMWNVECGRKIYLDIFEHIEIYYKYIQMHSNIL
jgi:hypothetical protein